MIACLEMTWIDILPWEA